MGCSSSVPSPQTPVNAPLKVDNNILGTLYDISSKDTDEASSLNDSLEEKNPIDSVQSMSVKPALLDLKLTGGSQSNVLATSKPKPAPNKKKANHPQQTKVSQEISNSSIGVGEDSGDNTTESGSGHSASNVITTVFEKDIIAKNRSGEISNSKQSGVVCKNNPVMDDRAHDKIVDNDMVASDSGDTCEISQTSCSCEDFCESNEVREDVSHDESSHQHTRNTYAEENTRQDVFRSPKILSSPISSKKRRHTTPLSKSNDSNRLVKSSPVANVGGEYDIMNDVKRRHDSSNSPERSNVLSTPIQTENEKSEPSSKNSMNVETDSTTMLTSSPTFTNDTADESRMLCRSNENERGSRMSEDNLIEPTNDVDRRNSEEDSDKKQDIIESTIVTVEKGKHNMTEDMSFSANREDECCDEPEDDDRQSTHNATLIQMDSATMLTRSPTFTNDTADESRMLCRSNENERGSRISEDNLIEPTNDVDRRNSEEDSDKKQDIIESTIVTVEKGKHNMTEDMSFSANREDECRDELEDELEDDDRQSTHNATNVQTGDTLANNDEPSSEIKDLTTSSLSSPSAPVVCKMDENVSDCNPQSEEDNAFSNLQSRLNALRSGGSAHYLNTSSSNCAESSSSRSGALTALDRLKHRVAEAKKSKKIANDVIKSPDSTKASGRTYHDKATGDSFDDESNDNELDITENMSGNFTVDKATAESSTDDSKDNSFDNTEDIGCSHLTIDIAIDDTKGDGSMDNMSARERLASRMTKSKIYRESLSPVNDSAELQSPGGNAVLSLSSNSTSPIASKVRASLNKSRELRLSVENMASAERVVSSNYSSSGSLLSLKDEENVSSRHIEGNSEADSIVGVLDKTNIDESDDDSHSNNLICHSVSSEIDFNPSDTPESKYLGKDTNVDPQCVQAASKTPKIHGKSLQARTRTKRSSSLPLSKTPKTRETVQQPLKEKIKRKTPVPLQSSSTSKRKSTKPAPPVSSAESGDKGSSTSRGIQGVQDTDKCNSQKTEDSSVTVTSSIISVSEVVSSTTDVSDENSGAHSFSSPSRSILASQDESHRLSKIPTLSRASSEGSTGSKSPARPVGLSRRPSGIHRLAPQEKK